MLNKPTGFVTTMSDPEGRPTVQDLLKGVKTRVYPVGRLDYNTEGLLLMTNDGDFAHLITHPRHEFPKTYLTKVKGVLTDKQIEMLEQGMFLQDGKTAPARVRKVRKEEANSWVEITIHEGRKRQVRRMFDHIGSSVIRLKRIKTGSLVLGDLPEGGFRHLTAEEVSALRETAMKTDETGRQVKVYKAPEKKKIEARAAGARTGDHEAVVGERAPRHGRPVMHDTRIGVRKNQGKRAVQGARPGTGRTEIGTREGFGRPMSRGEGPARSASRRPTPERAGQRSYGSREGFVPREARGEGPRGPASRRPTPERAGQRSYGSREGFVPREARGEGPRGPASRRPTPERAGQRSYGSGEGFVPRKARDEGPRGTAPRRSAPGRPGQKPAFGNKVTGRRPEGSGWKPTGARPNRSKYTGGKGPAARPSGPGRGPRGAGSRGPRR
jgi:pseudouridine synthase